MKVVIVEDDSDQLARLNLIIGSEKDIEVLGSYISAKEAIDNLERLAPDLLLTDINMPEMSGIELIREARALPIEMEIIAYTAHEDVKTVFEALKAGATGYILKTASINDLLSALREAVSGGVPMTPTIARAIISDMRENGGGSHSILSPREKEVLMDVEIGYSYKEVAGRLSVSVHTIHNHIRKIFEKLHVGNKQEALQKAHKRGLI